MAQVFCHKCGHPAPEGAKFCEECGAKIEGLPESPTSEETSVLLDTMSGYDFEEFVAYMLSKLGYGQVEKVLYTQDEGRDILIRSTEGLIVVECKHQPRSRIGRPIVQKLHSAVISSQATKGMLITTGHFTSEAIESAKGITKSGTLIEMVDRHILTDMASRAKIKLVSKGESLSVWTYSLPSEEKIHDALGSYVGSIAVSYPRPPE